MADEKPVDIAELQELGIEGKNVSRSELKARKAMAKLGLKNLPEINRVVIRKTNGSLFVIADADVYKTNTGESIFI